MKIKKNIILLCAAILIFAGTLTGTAMASATPTIAQIKAFGFNFAPRGWQHCDGQLLPIAQHTALFSLIGTIYGGDGRSTVGLPDLKGRFAMHEGRGPGLTSRRLGQRGGTPTETLVQSQIPSHTHGLRANSGSGNSDLPTNHSLAEKRRHDQYSSAAPDVSMMATAVSSAGGGQPHENMPPFLSLNYCISLQGQYPSRD